MTGKERENRMNGTREPEEAGEGREGKGKDREESLWILLILDTST